MIITLETSMIFGVGIQLFVVSSMFHQIVINESSMKKQWNINDLEVNTRKTMKIKNFSIDFVNVSNTSLQGIVRESSTKQQWNINVSEIRSKNP